VNVVPAQQPVAILELNEEEASLLLSALIIGSLILPCVSERIWVEAGMFLFILNLPLRLCYYKMQNIYRDKC
jgi:hypothetical protein